MSADAARRERPGPERRVRSRILDVAAVAVLLAISMVPLWPIYEHSAVVLLAGVGLVVGVTIAIVGARWPWYALAGLTVFAYGLIGVGLAVPTMAYARVLPTPQGLRELAVATVTAWRQMLTAQVPFGTYEALLVPALIVVLLASVVGASIALRAKRPGWAVLAPAAVLTFGIAFGSSQALWPAATGLALVVVALVWATLRADPIRTATGFAGSRRKLTASTIRRYVAALALIVVCGVGAGAANAQWPTGTHRDVLREDVIPPLEIRDLVSPLVGYRAQVLPPGADRTLLTVDGLPEGSRIRLATLDTYNGMVFAVGTDPSSGTFERVPYRIDRAAGDSGSATATSGAGNSGAGTRARVTMAIDELDGPWLPTVGDLVAVDFTDAEVADRFYYNTAAADAALLGGLTPTTYTLDTLTRAMPSLEDLAAAEPGRAHQKTIDTVPQAVVDAAQEHGTGDTPGERLISLTQWLRSGYVSHSGEDERFSRSGHSAQRLGILLTDTPMLGDAEQYAAAMALLAREVGFPSRVVVGYAPDAGQREITGADTTAWVEVQLADGTWVGLDPNPEPREVPTEDDTTPDYVARPQSVLPPPPLSNDEPVTTQNDDGDHEDPDDDSGWLTVLMAVLRGVGLGAGILALITLPVWGLAVAAWMRRRRRRRRDRKQLVVTGAWNELRDAMIDRGYEIHPAATRQEIAALTESSDIKTMAERADRGVFSGAGFVAADVGGYWSQVRGARRSLDEGTTRRMRLRRIVTLKSARSLRRSWELWRRAHGKGMP